MKKNLYTHKINGVLQFFALSALFILLFSGMAFAQTVHVIKGKVTDAETNETIPGVTVKVKGTTTAVATSASGDYSISVTTPAVLVFSFIGYNAVEVAVVNQGVINVKLTESSEQLKDVVVTALGVSKEKRAVGYSVSTVKGASLTEVRQNSFVNSLEGRVAGVNVSGIATGPNGATNVIIRGLTSLTGYNQPLYILNGTPLVNNNYAKTGDDGYGGHDGGDGIGDINPDDIESVSILKGAAATALYGYRGANGVVIITTKKGKAGDGLGIEINSNYVRENVIDNTDFQTKYGQGYNFAKPINAADALGSMESSWGAALDGSPVQIFNGDTTSYSEHAKGNMARFYRPGQNITNTVSFSKGFGDDGNTRFSVSELQDDSYVPNAGLQRFTFNQNTNLNFGKHLALTLASQYNSEYTKNAPSVSDAVGNLNWGPMFAPPNINITDLAGPYGNGTLANGYEDNSFANDIYTTNPYFAAYEFQEATHRNRFIGSIDLKYTADNGWYVKGSVADDYTNDRNTAVTPTGTAYQLGGGMYEQNVKQTELNIDIITGKEFTVSKDFKITPLLGVNYRKSIQEYVTASTNNFAIPFLYTITNGTAPTEGYDIYNQMFQSVYASADFSYKNWLYLTATGREDWYSTLAPGAKINYIYPSLSASFVYSDLVKIPNMTMGKLRLSYADVGGEADGSYQTLMSYGIQGTLAPGQNVFPIGPGGGGSVPNSALRPSKRREWEIGTEDDFYDNRLRIDLAYYHKNVIDDIIPVTIDYTSGFTSAILNVGNIRDVGFEFDLGGVPVKTEKFSWDVDFNGAYVSSKVLSLGGQGYIGLGSVEGDWTPEGNSLAHSEQIVGLAPNQIITFEPGRDANNKVIINKSTGVYSVQDRVTHDFGSANSPFAGGITNTFKFGDFDFSFLIDGKFGGKIFSNTNFIAYVQGLSKATLDRNPAGYGTNHIGAADYYSRRANADPGQFVYDDSFIKFRSLNFGYNLPVKMFHGAIHGLRVSAVCHNVFTMMKHTPNIDPESNYSQSIFSQGLEGPDVPYSRTLGLNLNIKL